MRYAAELEAIADLDREYYLNPSADLVDRSNYYKRQEDLEQIRHRLHSELCATDLGVQRVFRVLHDRPRCRQDANEFTAMLTQARP